MANDIIPPVGEPRRDLTTTDAPDPMLVMIQRAATDPNFDLQKFQALLDAWSAERKIRAHRAFNEAMAKSSAEMQAVPKDASNDYLKSRYAKLPGMLDVIKPITSANGLMFRFGTLPHPDPEWMTVTLILALGDHEEITALSGPIDKGEGIRGGKMQMTPIQTIGSTSTYLQRYLLGMVFTLIQHMPDIAQDDDGEASRRGGRGGASPASRPPVDIKPNIAVAVARFPGLQHQLLALPSTAALEAFKAKPRFVAFWDEWEAKNKEAGRMIDDLLRARRLDLEAAEAQAKASTPGDFAPDEPPAGSKPAADAQVTVSPDEQTLLDRISNCTAEAAISSLLTAPEFTQALAKLDFPAADRVTAALQARAAALKGIT